MSKNNKKIRNRHVLSTFIRIMLVRKVNRMLRKQAGDNDEKKNVKQDNTKNGNI